MQNVATVYVEVSVYPRIDKQYLLAHILPSEARINELLLTSDKDLYQQGDFID